MANINKEIEAKPLLDFVNKIGERFEYALSHITEIPLRKARYAAREALEKGVGIYNNKIADMENKLTPLEKSLQEASDPIAIKTIKEEANKYILIESTRFLEYIKNPYRTYFYIASHHNRTAFDKIFKDGEFEEDKSKKHGVKNRILKEIGSEEDYGQKNMAVYDAMQPHRHALMEANLALANQPN